MIEPPRAEMLTPISLLAVRILVALRLTPFLGGRPLPWPAWLALAAALLLATWPVALESGASIQGEGAAAWVVLAFREALIGACIGIFARLVFSVLENAGRLLETAALGRIQGGGEDEEGVTSRGPIETIYVVGGTAAFLLVGGHRALISALYGSARAVPLGAGDGEGGWKAVLDGAGERAAELFATSFGAAALIAAPVFAAALAGDALVAIALRAMPAWSAASGSRAPRTLAAQLTVAILLGAGVAAAVDVLDGGMRRIAGAFGA